MGCVVDNILTWGCLTWLFRYNSEIGCETEVQFLVQATYGRVLQLVVLVRTLQSSSLLMSARSWKDVSFR